MVAAVTLEAAAPVVVDLDSAAAVMATGATGVEVEVEVAREEVVMEEVATARVGCLAAGCYTRCKRVATHHLLVE